MPLSKYSHYGLQEVDAKLPKFHVEIQLIHQRIGFLYGPEKLLME
jgi:hypothetical protein